MILRCVSTCFILGVLLVFIPRPVSAQFFPPGSSIGPDVKGPIIGASIGIGAAAGVGIYLVHRKHTSLTGCVGESEHSLHLVTKAGKSFELLNAPGEIKLGERLSLRGHKGRTTSGFTFRIDRVSHDYGVCGS